MNINLTEIIRKAIQKLPVGEVVTSNCFPTVTNNTTNKILKRLVEEGLLVRIKRGVYSKCKTTPFGQAKATPLKVLAGEIAADQNKCFGGLFLLNQLGLTTQIPSTIEILNNRSKYEAKIGNSRVRYVRIRPKIKRITKEHIQMLEVIKKIMHIPDNDIVKTINWITNTLKNSERRKLKQLVVTAKDYPPRVRAILGSLLEDVDESYSRTLKKTLNENTYYRIGHVAVHLKNTSYWHLKNEQ